LRRTLRGFNRRLNLDRPATIYDTGGFVPPPPPAPHLPAAVRRRTASAAPPPSESRRRRRRRRRRRKVNGVASDVLFTALLQSRLVADPVAPPARLPPSRDPGLPVDVHPLVLVARLKVSRSLTLAEVPLDVSPIISFLSPSVSPRPAFLCLLLPAPARSLPLRRAGSAWKPRESEQR